MKKLYTLIFVLILTSCMGVEGEGLYERFKGISRVTQLSPYTIKLEWLGVVNVEQYEVYISTSDTPVGVTSSTEYMVEGLEPNRQYIFAVNAVYFDGREEGISIESNVIMWDRFRGASSGEAATYSEVDLSWDYDYPDVIYNVYKGLSSEEIDYSTSVKESTSTQVRVGGLIGDTEYKFVVRATYADGNVDDNEVEVLVRTLSAIDPMPEIFINPVTMGLSPRIEVSGAKGTYTTRIYTEEGDEELGFITGEGTVNIIGGVTLSEGSNKFYAVIEDGLGNSTVVEGLETVVKKFNTSVPSLVPYYNGLSKPFVSVRNPQNYQSGFNEIEHISSGGHSNTQNMRVGDFNCDGYMDLVLGVPGGSGDSESYCVNTSYHNYHNHCSTRSFGYMLVYYGTSDGFDGATPFMYSFENEARGSFIDGYNWKYSGGWGWALDVGNFNNDQNNGKSCDDIVITNKYADYRGAIGIFYGSSSGLQVASGTRLLQDINGTKQCFETGDCLRAFFYPDTVPSTYYNRFGTDVSVGDIDGDGYDDIVAGMYRTDNTDYMRVYIFFGSDGGVGVNGNSTQYAVITKSDEGGTYQRFGANVALADLDNDGGSDLFVTAYVKKDLNGTADIWQGEIIHIKSSLLTTIKSSLIGSETIFELETLLTSNPSDIDKIHIHPNAYYSGSLAHTFTFIDNGGDINGDGVDDLVAGASDDRGISNDGSLFHYAGSIYLIYGRDGFGPQIGSGVGDYVSGTELACDTGIPPVCKIQRIVNPYRTQRCSDGVNNNYCYYAPTISGGVDIDEDGFGDLLVSFPNTRRQSNNDYLVGELDIYYGTGTGLSKNPRKLQPSTFDSADMFGYLNVAGKFRGSSVPSDIVSIAYHKDKISVGKPEEITPEAYVFEQEYSTPGVIDRFSLNDTRQETYSIDVNYGVFANKYFDNNVYSAGDINGDGYDDVIMKGMSYYPNTSSTNNHYAIIYYGSDKGIISELNSGCVSPSIDMSTDMDGYICPQIMSSKYIHETFGGSTTNYFSYITHGVGDVNGDGYDDITSVGSGVYMFYGSNSGPIFNSLPATNPISSIDPKIVNTCTGGSLSCGNFVKASSSYGYWNLNGYLYSNGLAFQISSGDFNGDGYSDLVFLSSHYYIIILYGSSSGIQSDGHLTFYDESDNPDGDILKSELLGTANYPTQCEGEVPYLQCRALRIYPYDSNECQNGYSGLNACFLSYYVNVGKNLGDINGDGYDDLGVVLMRGYSSLKARSFIYFGSKEGLVVNGQIHPENNNIASPQVIQQTDIDYYAMKYSTGFAGDINGDGFNEYILGASYHSDRAYLFYGSLNGLKVNDVTFSDSDFTDTLSCPNGGGTSGMPDTSCTQLRIPKASISGYSTSYAGNSGTMGVGDINNDGYDDILQTYGNFYNTNSYSHTGGVIVYFGSRFGLRTFKDIENQTTKAVPKITPTCDVSNGLGCTPLIIMPDIPYLQLGKMSYFLSGDYNGDGSSDLLLGSKNIFFHKNKALLELGQSDPRLDYVGDNTGTGHLWYIYK